MRTHTLPARTRGLRLIVGSLVEIGSGMSHVPTLRLRSADFSDIHLGTRGCRADLLLELLKSVQVETLFLVGDVVDVRSLSRNVFWPQAHSNVVRALLGKAKHGTRVIA